MNKQLIGRRAAYLQRQQRVAERAAAAKEKECVRVRDFDRLFGLHKIGTPTFTLGNRGPCYGRLKSIFVRRLSEGNKKAVLPQPVWASR